MADQSAELMSLIKQLIALQQPESSSSSDQKPEDTKFDKTLKQAQQYGQIAQMLGGVMGAFQGPPLQSGGLPPVRATAAITPSARGFMMQSSGLSQQDLARLLALLSRR